MIELQGKLFLIHGPYKVGKTQLAASFPGPIKFIATEPGFRYLSEKQKKHLSYLEPGPKGWQAFSLMAPKIDKRYKTIVIDTIAPLYYMCLEHVCKKNGWGHPADGGHGKGWEATAREFRTQMGKLIFKAVENNTTVIWIDHSKLTEINTRQEVYHKIECAMPGQARGLVLPMPDNIWYLGYDELEGDDVMKHTSNNRTLWLKGTPVVEAGTQDPQISESSIDCVENLPISNQFKYIQDKLNNAKKRSAS